MPPDNVDIVTRYLEGTGAPGGDRSPWDASEEAIRAWFDRFWEPNGDYYDRVLAHGHLYAEGPGSGVALEGDVYHCCWLRHGRLVRVEDHLTEQGALRAIGLP